jgi:hypothetical protein
MSARDTNTTAGKVAVMQAALAGKPLESRLRDGSGEWKPMGPPSTWETTWDWLNRDYRISPTPREWCIYVDAETGQPRWAAWTAAHAKLGIRVREVLEND